MNLCSFFRTLAVGRCRTHLRLQNVGRAHQRRMMAKLAPRKLEKDEVARGTLLDFASLTHCLSPRSLIARIDWMPQNSLLYLRLYLKILNILQSLWKLGSGPELLPIALHL